MGQVVSEIGDHFNSIAVLSLTLHLTGSGLAVGGVMIARVLPSILAGPFAGVLLDRMDRRAIMILSDLARSVIAAAFVLILTHQQHWLLYFLSGLLTFASPFFTSGRSAILPKIASAEELHTANALTQTTAWLTLSIGTMLGGISTMQFGYTSAFYLNALSFLFSAWAIWRVKGHFRPLAAGTHSPGVRAFWNDFTASLKYMHSEPLILAIGLAGVGWASGGGAAQVLFTLFGELVYRRGPAGIGMIWGSAGLGLVAGGVIGHSLGKRLRFEEYKRTVSICFLVHGISYILFAVVPSFAAAIFFIALSRLAMGINNVLNRTMLLTHVPDHFRGRVLTTTDTMTNVVMIFSLSAAGVATEHYSIRTVGAIAGALSASTTIFWAWADLAGKLPEPLSRVQDAESDLESPITSP
ncbi:MAG: major facilitator superfamily 1 [Bryobacterales bacterium]|nr:major facilitator superfamily 1 [Bryobacterales bacterium]